MQTLTTKKMLMLIIPWCGIGGMVSPAEGGVVGLLAVMDDAFHREEGKDRPPPGKDECLPETSHSAVAVLEGMDKLEFIVKNATGEKRMLVGRFYRGKQTQKNIATAKIFVYSSAKVCR